MIDDAWCRKRLRGMLIDFYKDLKNSGFCDSAQNYDLQELFEFIENWIEENFIYKEQ